MLKVIVIVILLIEAALFSVMAISEMISDIRVARDIKSMIKEFEAGEKNDSERDAGEE